MNIGKLMRINQIIEGDNRFDDESKDYIKRAVHRSIQIDRLRYILECAIVDIPAIDELLRILDSGDNPMDAMSEFIERRRRG